MVDNFFSAPLKLSFLAPIEVLHKIHRFRDKFMDFVKLLYDGSTWR